MTLTSQHPVVRLSALVGIAGAFGLTACTAAESGAAAPGSGGEYADGSYTAEGTYSTPETVETISVTVTLEDGIVTDVGVAGSPQRPESKEFQGRFIGGIAAEVVGRPIDEVRVSRVAGSSLTSGGFNQAIERIRAEASEGAD